MRSSLSFSKEKSDTLFPCSGVTANMVVHKYSTAVEQIVIVSLMCR